MAVVLLLPACAHTGQQTKNIPEPPLNADKPAELRGLHNVVSYAPRFMSGSAPDGDAGFETLREMGVRIIISVDGGAPDVATAKAHGLKYIHLPIGYNGMDHHRTLEIAKAVELAEKDGPVYIHCHHGQHRSAAAAGATAVTLGWLSEDAATAKLHVSGTSPAYKGLYACVAAAYPVKESEFSSIESTFPEISRPSGYIQTMGSIEEALDHLKQIEKAGWKPPATSPDLVPVAEAGRLADLFRNLAQSKAADSKPAAVRPLLMADSKKAEAIEAGLNAPQINTSDLSQKLRSLANSCTECHAKYRD